MNLVSNLSLTLLVFSGAFTFSPLCTQAEEPAANPPSAPSSAPTAAKPNAVFVQAPDPSSLALPPALSLRPNTVPEVGLDALPSFAPPASTPAEADLPDFRMRRRENISMVPDGPNPTEDAAVSLNRRYRFQAARSRALGEPAVQEALQAAQKARTDREVRAALARHYNLLYARMRVFDSGLEPLIAERERAALEPLREKLQRSGNSSAPAAATSR